MFIGVDVSKAVIDCVYFQSSKPQHAQFENSTQGFAQAVQWAPTGAHWVMEATGVYHQNLALHLHRQDLAVSVVNPLVIKRFGQMQLRRAKTDKADAALIAEYAGQATLVEWQAPAEVIIQLNQLDHWCESLIRRRTVLSNQREALRHSAYAYAFVMQQLDDQLQTLELQIKTAEQKVDLLTKQSFPELYQRLQSIPSIGQKTASKLIVTTDGFTRFDNHKQLTAYAGMAPRTHQSGTSVKGRSGIVKLGQGRIRQLLYMCSLSAVQSNPACKRLSERLKAKGKPGRVIRIAIATKLLRQAFAVAKSGQYFSIEQSFA